MSPCIIGRYTTYSEVILYDLETFVHIGLYSTYLLASNMRYAVLYLSDDFLFVFFHDFIEFIDEFLEFCIYFSQIIDCDISCEYFFYSLESITGFPVEGEFIYSPESSESLIILNVLPEHMRLCLDLYYESLLLL